MSQPARTWNLSHEVILLLDNGRHVGPRKLIAELVERTGCPQDVAQRIVFRLIKDGTVEFVHPHQLLRAVPGETLRA